MSSVSSGGFIFIPEKRKTKKNKNKKCRQIAEQTRKEKLPNIQTSYLWEVFCSSSWLKNVRRSGSELRLLKKQTKHNLTCVYFKAAAQHWTLHCIHTKPEIWIRLEVQTTFVCDTKGNSPQNLMSADWLAPWWYVMRELKQARRRRQQKTPQIWIFDNKKQYFCTLCTCIFHFLTFWRRSRSFYDVKWPVLQLCGRREHKMTTVQFCLLLSQALVPI